MLAHPNQAGSIVGRDLRTGSPIVVRWQRGEIIELSPASEQPISEKLWIAPPLVDVQVNGYGGIDFQGDQLEVADLRQAVDLLRKDGCSRFLLTLITDEWSVLLSRLRHLRLIRAQSEILAHAIAGWHLEGPFLSSKPGYHGAHNPSLMLDPTSQHIQQIREASGDDAVMLTMAPELTGAMEAIRLAVSLGMKVSLGHTDANSEVLAAAVEAGATGFTHLGNACPQMLDRHDNILFRVLNQQGLRVGLIPDGIHVSKDCFRIAHRVMADRIYYTTDAMSAAGAPPGRYRLGSSVLEVGSDEIVRKPGAQNFAGSALRPIEGVIRASLMLDEPWQKTWMRFSDRLTEWMGWDPGLRLGGPSEFCLIEAQPGGRPRLIQELTEA